MLLMVKKMNENNELIVLLYENTKMGVNNTKKLITLIKEKDNKIKFILEEQLQRYESLFKKCKKLIKEQKIKIPKSGILKSFTAITAMTMEVNKDNSDSKIASIMTRGFTMGNINIEAKIKEYNKEANKDTINLANEILDFGEKQVELLKNYL